MYAILIAWNCPQAVSQQRKYVCCLILSHYHLPDGYTCPNALAICSSLTQLEKCLRTTTGRNADGRDKIED